MSLIEPNFFARYKKWLIYGGLVLALVFVSLGLYQCGSDYFFDRRIDKMKANVNATLEEAKQVNANIQAEKEAANKIAANVEKAAQEYLEATNVTDATRANVNAAIERMKEAANKNRNVNAEDVENAMRGL